MPSKTIRFRESPQTYVVDMAAPWMVHLPGIGYKRAADLVLGDRIERPQNLPHFDSVPIFQHVEDRSILTVAAIVFDTRDLFLTDLQARVATIGDSLLTPLGLLTITDVDFSAGLVSFHNGARIPFPSLSMCSHDDGSPIVPIEPTPPEALTYIARARPEPLTVYHIPEPGWYTIPTFGPYDFSAVDPDVFVEFDGSTMHTHDGGLFRQLYRVAPVGASSADPVADMQSEQTLEEPPALSWQRRLSHS